MEQPKQPEAKTAEGAQKQIELSPERAAAVNAAIDRLNAQNELAQARIAHHQEVAQFHSGAAQREQQAFQRMVAMHQTHIAALVKEAGLNPEDFQQHGVFTEGGKAYLRARPADTQQH